MRICLYKTLTIGLIIVGLLLTRFAHAAESEWHDPSPHKTGFIHREGVKLHYLDWGGRGDTLLFVPGAGCTAHIFDDIAPQFTNSFRVLAVTRRGFGESDRPASGYGLDVFVEDIHALLDELKIKRAIFAGHSFGGYEITQLTLRYPKYAKKLIYLDATFDPTSVDKIFPPPVPFPEPSQKDTANLDSFCAWFQSTYNLEAPALKAEFYYATNSSKAAFDSFSTSLKTLRIDYSHIKVPALSFVADAGDRTTLFLSKVPNPDMEKIKAYVVEADEARRLGVERFRKQVRRTKIIEMPDTDHLCFTQRPEETVREMKKFLRVK